MLTFEFEPPTESDPCPCCGEQTTSLTRFVYSDGDAHAVYFAQFAVNHPERFVVATVSLGRWGDGTIPQDRVAFALKLRCVEGNFQVMVVDAAESPWQEAEIIGRTLDRAEALGHPWIKEVFHITDHMVVEDVPLRDYLENH